MQPNLFVEPSIYNKPFPNFNLPKIIGYIGLENLKFTKRVCNERVCFDLNLGLKNAIVKDDFDVKLTELLKFLCEHIFRLNCIFESKLESAREPWKLVAVLHKGNIFLCARDTEDKIMRKRNMTEHDKKFTSWGYKFEQFMLSDSPVLKPNPNIPVNENEEFSLIFKTNLNRHTIIYGAEMDGIICDNDSTPLPPSKELGVDIIINYLTDKKFVELKTNRHIEFPKQETNFRRFKCKKWWCQSFLAGVDTIVCGFRNDEGIVEELETIKTADLPKKCQRFWNPNVCFNFLDTFLTYVKRCIARKLTHKYGDKSINNLQNIPLVSLLFEWTPGRPIQVNEDYVYEDDPILPQWFIDSYKKHNQ